MITEDYVSSEIATLLEEKGFDSDECEVHYDPYNHQEYEITLQMAMKWLRGEYKIFICIVFLDDTGAYGFTIEDMSSKKYLATSKNDGYPTYEEACEASIKYCLENLI